MLISYPGPVGQVLDLEDGIGLVLGAPPGRNGVAEPDDLAFEKTDPLFELFDRHGLDRHSHLVALYLPGRILVVEHRLTPIYSRANSTPARLRDKPPRP